MNSFEPGRRVGPYQIVGPLGAGGMGEVYRARDTRLARDVAIKVLPVTLSADSERLARLQREAQVLASLNHPGIAAIYGLEDASGAPALVLELVEGPTLADRIAQGPLPIDESLGIARQIAEALEYAHERGVIHRDLKPANVKLGSDGRVKLLDFGLAKAIAGDPSSGGSDPSMSPTLTSLGTMTGAILGTAAYMSPEQARGRTADRRADIWGFGAVLWEMLTGKRLFEGETISDTLASVLREQVDWKQIPSSTPPRIVRLLKRCLERDPKQRLRDIGEARILLEGEGDASEPEPASAAPAPRPLTAAGRLLAVLPWALVAVMAIGVFSVLALRSKASPRTQPTRFEIAHDEGNFSWPRLSPDGRTLAFLGRDANGKQLIYIRPLDSFTAAPLTGPENPSRPFWSPDGRFLAYFSKNQLMKVPVAGGPAQVICESEGSDGSWGADGQILFDGQAAMPIRRCPASGGIVADEVKPDTGETGPNPAWPFFLPDGRHYLFTANASGGAQQTLKVASLGDAKVKTLIPVDSRVEYSSGFLVYILRGSLVAHRFDPERLEVLGDPIPLSSSMSTAAAGYFSVSGNGSLAFIGAGQTGNTQLVWVDRDGKELSKEGEPGPYTEVALSPDGTRLAYELSDDHQEDIWIRDLKRGVAMRLTTSPKNEVWPTWSADGSKIYYSSDSGGTYAIMRRSSSGTGAEEQVYTVKGDNLGVGECSKDGKWLSFDQYHGGNADCVLLDLLGGRSATPLLHEAAVERELRFSPDGRWFAYTSNETGKNEIYVQPYPPTGSKWTISTAGGSTAHWRADGKELFYQGPDQTIFAVPMTLGASFAAGSPKQLFRRPMELNGIVRNRWVPASDGQRFLVNAAIEEVSKEKIKVVLDWAQTLAANK